jgi:hypothetical protein
VCVCVFTSGLQSSPCHCTWMGHESCVTPRRSAGRLSYPTVSLTSILAAHKLNTFPYCQPFLSERHGTGDTVLVGRHRRSRYTSATRYDRWRYTIDSKTNSLNRNWYIDFWKRIRCHDTGPGLDTCWKSSNAQLWRELATQHASLELRHFNLPSAKSVTRDGYDAVPDTIFLLRTHKRSYPLGSVTRISMKVNIRYTSSSRDGALSCVMLC